ILDGKLLSVSNFHRLDFGEFNENEVVGCLCGTCFGWTLLFVFLVCCGASLQRSCAWHSKFDAF
ncbi:MAG TPA: hypothetical protein VL860_00560, partial [Planctomycetota bacterium]|nr:hypothetical protein [Planctomycetota bacterium]